MAMQVIEVLGHGFNAGDDSTDDRVLWVRAESPEVVRVLLNSAGVPFVDLDVNDVKYADDVVDFTLPADASQLVTRLLSFIPTHHAS